MSRANRLLCLGVVLWVGASSLAADPEKLPFKPAKFAGRKAKSERTVIMELFTGAQCPPCVAADVAFDGLDQTYKPTDVILLQYHMHIPGPDPMTNPDTVARFGYYRELRDTPSTLFNGKPKAGGGGALGMAEKKYKAYRDIIDPLLEEPAPVASRQRPTARAIASTLRRKSPI
jgi:hypothetical protein